MAYWPVYLSRYSDWLRAGRSGDRIPWGPDFPHPSRTVLWAHPASCTMGTGSCPRVKRTGRGVQHTAPSGAEVQGREEQHICSLSGPSWPVLGWPLTLPLRFGHGLVRIKWKHKHVTGQVCSPYFLGLFYACIHSVPFIASLSRAVVTVFLGRITVTKWNSSNADVDICEPGVWNHGWTVNGNMYVGKSN